MMLPERGRALLFVAEGEFLTELFPFIVLSLTNILSPSLLLLHLIFLCIYAEKDSDNYLNNMTLVVKGI